MQATARRACWLRDIDRLDEDSLDRHLGGNLRPSQDFQGECSGLYVGKPFGTGSSFPEPEAPAVSNTAQTSCVNLYAPRLH